MAERAGEDHELDHKQQHQAARLVVLVLAENGEIPGYPHQDAESDLVGDFDGDVGDQEGNPGVGF